MRPVCIFLHRRSLVQLLTKAQQISIGTLVGKTRMLILPDYTPWQDGLPHFSPKTVVQACLKFLEEGIPKAPSRTFTLAICQGIVPPDPNIAPLMDRRVDFWKLMGRVKEILVFPLVKVSTGTPELSLIPREVRCSTKRANITETTGTDRTRPV